MPEEGLCLFLDRLSAVGTCHSAEAHLGQHNAEPPAAASLSKGLESYSTTETIGSASRLFVVIFTRVMSKQLNSAHQH